MIFLEFEGTVSWVCILTICLVALKAVIGFHFPWETCPCCSKKWREHKKEV